MADPANAKNALTVGASRNNRSKGGYAALTWADAWADRYPAPPIGKQRISGDAECLAAFSARGPDLQRLGMRTNWLTPARLQSLDYFLQVFRAMRSHRKRACEPPRTGAARDG